MPFLQIRQYFVKQSTSVLVPAFEAESFICETLDSIKNQVFEDFKVLISVDKSDDDTASVVKRWCKENKISTQIFIQKNRLGWVKNINFLLRKCKTKYFMVMPHDDLLEKTYIQKMIQGLKNNPKACVVFSDIQGFGLNKPLISQKSIKGNRLERTTEFLNHHFNAVAFRGLIDREIISDFLLLSENNPSNFAIDTIWNLQMALKGELVRVPEVLYHKRYFEESVHDSWQKSTNEEKTNMWLEHCRDCINVIFKTDFGPDELGYLIETVKKRLHQNNSLWFHENISNLNEKDRESLEESLEQTIIDLGDAKNYSMSQLLPKRFS